MTNASITEAALAVLDAGDALISLLDRLGNVKTDRSNLDDHPLLAECLVTRILHHAEDWRTASRQLLNRLIDEQEEPQL